MKEFTYKAYNKAGKIVSGSVRAESRELALTEITSSELHTFELKMIDSKTSKGSKAVAYRAGSRGNGLIVFTRQLSNLLLAGIQLAEALELLSRIMRYSKFSELINKLSLSLKEGKELSAVMEEFPGVFSPGYISIIRAGEESGYLGLTCQRLADDLEEKSKLKSYLLSSLIYPLVLVFVASIAILVMLLYVLPRFVTIYDSYQSSLPWTTQMLLKFSQHLSYYGLWVLIAIVVVLIWWGYYKNTSQGRIFKDSLYLRLPVIRGLVNPLIVSRITHSLGTMLDNGVPLLKALKISGRVSNNYHYNQEIKQIAGAVESGEGLASTLEHSAFFPEMAVYLIAVGEQTGKLSSMLLQVSDFFEEEYRGRLDRIIKLFEPAMMLLMGGIIGLIVISMLLPIMSIGSLL